MCGLYLDTKHTLLKSCLYFSNIFEILNTDRFHLNVLIESRWISDKNKQTMCCMYTRMYIVNNAFSKDWWKKWKSVKILSNSDETKLKKLYKVCKDYFIKKDKKLKLNTHFMSSFNLSEYKFTILKKHGQLCSQKQSSINQIAKQKLTK